MDIRRIIFFTAYCAVGGWFVGSALNSPIVWLVFGAIIGVGIGMSNWGRVSQDSSQQSKSSITNNVVFRMVSGAIQMATVGAIIGSALGDIGGIIIGGVGGTIVGLVLGKIDS